MKSLGAALCFGVLGLGGLGLGIGPLSAAADAQEPADSAWARYPSVTEIEIEDAAARVFIAPQLRGDSAVGVVNRGPLPDPTVRVQGSRLTLDGELRRIDGCSGDGSVTVAGYGRVAAEDLPVIYVRTPESLVFSGEGALTVSSAPATAARVALAGCSTGDLGPVADLLQLRLAGEASAVAGPSARARVAIAGDGDAQLGPVQRDLDVAIAGSGRVGVGAVNGPVRIAIQGDGYVDLGSGHAEDLRVAIAGQGHVRFNGAAEAVSAAIAGSGLIEVAAVEGQVEQRIAGTGAVRVGPVGPPHAALAPRPPVPPRPPVVP